MSASTPPLHPLVGAWRVKTIDAPFPYHMFAFHSDGTMQQSNPPAGNIDTSDTAGLGVWEDKKGKLRARFEEFRVSYQDNTVTRGVITFELTLDGDTLTGTCAFTVYDPETNELLHGPHPATLQGQRVTLD